MLRDIETTGSEARLTVCAAVILVGAAEAVSTIRYVSLAFGLLRAESENEGRKGLPAAEAGGTVANSWSTGSKRGSVCAVATVADVVAC